MTGNLYRKSRGCFDFLERIFVFPEGERFCARRLMSLLLTTGRCAEGAKALDSGAQADARKPGLCCVGLARVLPPCQRIAHRMQPAQYTNK